MDIDGWILFLLHMGYHGILMDIDGYSTSDMSFFHGLQRDASAELRPVLSRKGAALASDQRPGGPAHGVCSPRCTL